MQTNQQQPYRPTGLTLVLGGTGKTGQRVVRRLRDKNLPVRIGSRSASPSFDWNDATGWDACLRGVGSVYISYSPDLAIPGATDTIRAFTDLAVRRGVGRLVLLSGRGEPEARACERIVRESGADWTIVRASWFNQNFSEGEFAGMVVDGSITLPAGDIPEPFVDIDDIADVVVAALTEPGHGGETYELTGPRLMTFTDIADELSRATGRDIAYIELPHRDFMAGIAQAGIPEEIAWLLDYLFSTVLDGRNAYLADGVQRALGRAPRDFSEFARQVARSGQWDAAA